VQALDKHSTAIHQRRRPSTVPVGQHEVGIPVPEHRERAPQSDIVRAERVGGVGVLMRPIPRALQGSASRKRHRAQTTQAGQASVGTLHPLYVDVGNRVGAVSQRSLRHDQVGEVVGIGDQGWIGLMDRHPRAVQARAIQPLPCGLHLGSVGLESEDLQLRAPSKFQSQAAIAAANVHTESLRDSRAAHDFLCGGDILCICRRRRCVGRFGHDGRGRRTGAEAVDPPSIRTHEQPAMRHGQPAGRAGDFALPDHRASCQVHGHHTILSTHDNRVARDDQGGRLTLDRQFDPAGGPHLLAFRLLGTRPLGGT